MGGAQVTEPWARPGDTEAEGARACPKCPIARSNRSVCLLSRWWADMRLLYLAMAADSLGIFGSPGGGSVGALAGSPASAAIAQHPPAT